ncbi:MAG: ComEC/Rec2 family competence protein [Bacteroidales bacterium]
MQNHLQNPLLPIALSLFLGILCGGYINTSFFSVTILTFISINILIIALWKLLFLKTAILRTEIALLLHLFILSFTFSYLSYHLPKERSCNENTRPKIFIAKVKDIFKEKESSIQYRVQLFQKTKTNTLSYHKESALIILNSKDSNSIFQRGDYILLRGIEINGKKPIFKGEFNYFQYLKYNNIDKLIISSSDKILQIKHLKSEQFYTYLLSIKANIQNHIHSYSNKSGGMISALLLGDKTSFNSEQSKRLQNIGATHFFCVSGFHVGILYLVFHLLSSLIFKNEQNKTYFCLFLSLLILPLYNILCNLNDSTIRASLMIFIYSIFRIRKTYANKWHVLFLTAITMIIINPNCCFDVGFQLSFSALSGIFLFYSRIYNYIKSRNKTVNYFGKIITISISAQLGSMPISLLYFNYFPFYFLLSNLILLPLISIYYWMILLLLPISYISSFTAICFRFLDFTSSLIQQTVICINKLPYSQSKLLSFDFFDSLFFITVLILLYLYIQKKHPKILLGILSCILIFFSLKATNPIPIHGKEEVIIDKKQAILFFNRGKAFLCNQKKHKNINKQFKNWKIHNNIDTIINIPSNQKLFYSSKDRIIKLDNIIYLDGKIFYLDHEINSITQ